MSKVFIPKSISAKLNGVISRGVLAMEIDKRGHLIVTLTDNTEVDLGKVKGDSGVYVGAEEPTDDSVLVWITVDEGDVPDVPTATKLAAPTIRLVTDGEDSGGDDSGDVPDAGTLTPAILGVAILGRTILGMTDVGGEKLATPVIQLTTGTVLAAPEIELVEV